MCSRQTVLLLATLMAFISASRETRADSLGNTVMTVGEMCGGCVKKITARLKQMPNLVEVKCDIAKKTVTVVPGDGGPSPRALWDAMEEIGKRPIRMVTASGTFTEKPKS